MRKYGLTIDHVRSIEVVTADGEIVTASATEHPDLFWALRGGGGNFGVATSFEVELHPAGMVYGGAIFYDASEAATVLPAYARYAAAAPEELTTMALLMAAPPAPFVPPEMRGKPVVGIALVYSGDFEEGNRVVDPLRSWVRRSSISSGRCPIRRSSSSRMTLAVRHPAIYALGDGRYGG